MKTYLRVLSYAKPIGKYAIPYAIFALLAILFGLINYSFLMPTLDILFGQNITTNSTQIGGINIRAMMEKFTADTIMQYGKSGALVIICSVLIVSNFITNFFKYFSNRTINKVRADVVRKLRADIFNKIIGLHIGFFSNEKKGDLVSRITNDVQEVENSVVNSLTVLFRDPATIIIYFAVLFMLSWKLTVITLIILPTSGFIISTISKRLKKQSDEGQKTLGSILSIVDETMTGMRVMLAFNAQKYVTAKFDNENNKYSRILRSMTDKRELSSPLSEFLGVSVVAVILFLGGNMVFNNEMKASEFFFYIISFYQILVPAKAISASFSNIQRGLSSAERIFKVMDVVPLINESVQVQSISELKNELTFQNVSFAYEKNLVLKNIDLIIPKGKTIALVGPSGGGKSTLADLIPRFHDVSSGKITIDGIDIKNCSLHSLRGLMGIVTQESILFNDTIFNNIAFGKPDASEEEVIQAAKVANAHEFIVKTEEGYHTNIGDRGMKLSGGQRQRISIARAVLKNPPILILDEATSALDAESEKLVQEALSNLMKNRTSIVIAHRLSTIQHADEIIVIRKGEIEERGTHQALMDKNGLYKKLHGHALSNNSN